MEPASAFAVLTLGANRKHVRVAVFFEANPGILALFLSGNTQGRGWLPHGRGLSGQNSFRVFRPSLPYLLLRAGISISAQIALEVLARPLADVVLVSLVRVHSKASRLDQVI